MPDNSVPRTWEFFVQSFAFGVMFGLFVGLGVWVGMGAPGKEAFGIGLLAYAGGQFAWFFFRLWGVVRIEERLNRDIDGDGWVGEPEEVEPEPPAPQRAVFVEQPARTHTRQTFNLPFQPEPFLAFAEGVLQGISTTETAWTGDGKPFSKREYHALRGWLIDQRWAAWVNPDAPAQGWQITGQGRAALRYVLSHAGSDDMLIVSPPAPLRELS